MLELLPANNFIRDVKKTFMQKVYDIIRCAFAAEMSKEIYILPAGRTINEIMDHIPYNTKTVVEVGCV